jgi:hypothetical protein
MNVRTKTMFKTLPGFMCFYLLLRKSSIV